MTLEEFKKQGYQLIQYAKITEERSIDLSDYDPTKKINEYETPFSLEYNVKYSYFDDSSFPLEYEILDELRSFIKHFVADALWSKYSAQFDDANYPIDEDTFIKTAKTFVKPQLIHDIEAYYFV